MSGGGGGNFQEEMSGSVCLSVAKNKPFRAVACIDDKHEVLHELSKNPFLNPMMTCDSKPRPSHINVNGRHSDAVLSARDEW